MNTGMRWFLGVVILIIAGATGFQLAKPYIAKRLFERALTQTVGVDRSAAYGDGLHVYLCGTGSPMADTTRAGPCMGVVAGNAAFIIDTGSGSVRKLSRMGFPMEKLQTLYLTHLHSDHIDGIGELMLQAWIAGRRDEPLPVYGPVGTTQVINGFNQAYELDKGYRIAHHGPEVAIPSGFGGAPHEMELTDDAERGEVIFADGDLTIRAIRVDHAPIDPAFGYRIDYKDRSVSFSGDTVFHPGFIAMSSGVDVMFHEALDPEMVAMMGDELARKGQPELSQIMTDIQNYHTTPEEAAKAAHDANATELVYYHIVPPLPSRLLDPVFLGDAKSEFDGRITVGEDGMIISLPAGETSVVHRKGL